MTKVTYSVMSPAQTTAAVEGTTVAAEGMTTATTVVKTATAVEGTTTGTATTTVVAAAAVAAGMGTAKQQRKWLQNTSIFFQSSEPFKHKFPLLPSKPLN